MSYCYICENHAVYEANTYIDAEDDAEVICYKCEICGATQEARCYDESQDWEPEPERS